MRQSQVRHQRRPAAYGESLGEVTMSSSVKVNRTFLSSDISLFP
jgi:hypothetical protein